MNRQALCLMVNGTPYERSVEPSITLLQFLRDELGLTGTKCGCGNGECGACTVLLDGRPVRSCIILAVEAQGAEIVTVEGLAVNGAPHRLQRAFAESGAVQCGFCIPGVLMGAKALLDRHPEPSAAQVEEALGGHLCRCAGYHTMSKAVGLSLIHI